MLDNWTHLHSGHFWAQNTPVNIDMFLFVVTPLVDNKSKSLETILWWNLSNILPNAQNAYLNISLLFDPHVLCLLVAWVVSRFTIWCSKTKQHWDELELFFVFITLNLTIICPHFTIFDCLFINFRLVVFEVK